MPSRRLERPIVAVAEDLACVDMVDGRLIENLHVDDGRGVLARADAITEHATHRLTLRRQARGETDREGPPLLAEQRRWPSALAARSARAAVGATFGGDEGSPSSGRRASPPFWQ